MKLTKIAFLFAGSFVSIVGYAADQSSGCGLGWEVTQKNSLVSSSIRTTTNTFLPNTFSMTSGTSGCTKHSIVQREKEQLYFVESNLEQLSIEVAQGSGEYLTSFASLMGCSAGSQDFAKVMQSQFEVLTQDLPQSSASAPLFLDRVRATIQSSGRLATACTHVS